MFKFLKKWQARKPKFTPGQKRWFWVLQYSPLVLSIPALLITIFDDNFEYSELSSSLMSASGLWMFLIIGLQMYLIREKDRVVYGAIEIVFALLLTYFTFYFQVLDRSLSLLDVSVRLGGCLYVLVRGLDNFNQGVRPYPRANRRWRWWILLEVEQPQPVVEYPWTRHLRSVGSGPPNNEGIASARR